MIFRRFILLSICLVLWLETLLNIGVTKVEGTSMYNTLKDGSYHFYASTNMRKIHRFDIVLVQSEVLNTYIIKRVVGFPGERVTLSNDVLYINGQEVEQNFDFIPNNDNMDYVLQDDEYVILGDNRPVSIDSRYIGPVKEDEIKNVLINHSL